MNEWFLKQQRIISRLSNLAAYLCDIIDFSSQNSCTIDCTRNVWQATSINKIEKICLKQAWNYMFFSRRKWLLLDCVFQGLLICLLRYLRKLDCELNLTWDYSSNFTLFQLF